MGNTEKNDKLLLIPKDIRFNSWEEIKPFFHRLMDSAPSSTDDLDQWLETIRQLKASLHQEKTQRYIEMTCKIDDPQKRIQYQNFIQEIEPKYKLNLQKLNKKILPLYDEKKSHEKPALRQGRTGSSKKRQYQKSLELKAKENKLKASYQHLMGQLYIQYNGQKLRLNQSSRLLREIDRPVRRSVWKAQAEQWRYVKNKAEEILSKLIHLRTQIARQSEFKDYREYIFHAYKRTDYSPQECTAFHELCKKHFVPLLKKGQKDRQKKLGLDSLKPFDLLCDEEGLPPLRPSATGHELITKAQYLFTRLAPQLGAWFQHLTQNKMIDIVHRAGKAPGAYCVKLERSGQPFIFMNATGTQEDLITLLHEAGHAFHFMAMAKHSGIPQREMCELAALGMEVLGINDLSSIYSKKDEARAKKQYFQQTVSYFTGIATIDAFEHWLYTNAEHTVEERRQCWLNLSRTYLGNVDYTGYQDLEATSYHQTALLFATPFYFIEYAFARLGALQLWENLQKDKSKCLKSYLHALSLGAAGSLGHLYQAAGVEFGFTQKALKQTLSRLQHESS